MAFIRTKKINGISYYYLVENKRIDGKVRQKVIKYLGKNKDLVPKKELKKKGFLRIKRINEHSYYYLVRNVRADGKVRQKVLKYIGKSENLARMIQNE